MNITYTNGSKGTATVEAGKHGGAVLVLRRGFPVAAEIVAGIKAEQVSRPLLDALGVSGESAELLDGYRMARESFGDSYADYLIEHDAEYAAKGIPLTPWPLSLVGNDGE